MLTEHVFTPKNTWCEQLEILQDDPIWTQCFVHAVAHVTGAREPRQGRPLHPSHPTTHHRSPDARRPHTQRYGASPSDPACSRIRPLPHISLWLVRAAQRALLV